MAAIGAGEDQAAPVPALVLDAPVLVLGVVDNHVEGLYDQEICNHSAHRWLSSYGYLNQFIR